MNIMNSLILFAIGFLSLLYIAFAVIVYVRAVINTSPVAMI